MLTKPWAVSTSEHQGTSLWILLCASRVLMCLYLLNVATQDSFQMQCRKLCPYCIWRRRLGNNWPPPSLAAEFKCCENFTWGILGRREIQKVDLNLKNFILEGVLFLNAWHRYVYKENRCMGKHSVDTCTSICLHRQKKCRWFWV